MVKSQPLDPHQKPPETIKIIYKHFQKLSIDAIREDSTLLDFQRGLNGEQTKKCKEVKIISGQNVKAACLSFQHHRKLEVGPCVDVLVFEHEDAPGLFLVPALLPEPAQKILLATLMHQMLAAPCHKTNVHAHHEIPYHATHATHDIYAGSSEAYRAQPEGDVLDEPPMPFETSFFNMSPESSELFQPLNPETHQPMKVSQFLRKKLRWLTLGAQYDWTRKIYPKTNYPPFPAELAIFTQKLFPGMKPEAAIVNIYSPGNTLSVHRDVSEESENGLVSISLGCDGIFVAGVENGDGNKSKVLAVRVRSGDAIYMCGPSRFMWHGVPQIIANTCPTWLKRWPAEEKTNSYGEWSGWMLDKRINLNMRQVLD